MRELLIANGSRDDLVISGFDIYRGEGRGPITRDGCAVELYRQLPYRGEMEIIGRLVHPGSSVLELGCGTGRLTRALLRAGHQVTAVDNSPEMLREVTDDATKVLSNIESLELDRRFDVALLASCLINTPLQPLRQAQLSACRRHLSSGGLLVFERFDPHWLRTVEIGALGRVGEVAVTVEHAARDGNLVNVSLLYAAAVDEWRQHFSAIVLDDDDIQGVLAQAGFDTIEWIGSRWGAARTTP